MTTRCIAFAGSVVAVEPVGARAVRIVAFLFGHLPDGTAAPHTTLTLAEVRDGLRLTRDGRTVAQTDSDGTMAEVLLGEVGYHLADRSTGGVLFHAAALALNGQGIILPGSMGAGKTTLTAWLAAHGYTYLSDESVYVPEGATAVTAFARPLNLKRAARPHLPHLFAPAPLPGILSSEDADLVPLALLPSSAVGGETSLRAIVFPRYTTGAAFACEALTPAQAGLALMQTLVNGRNLPAHGFHEVARLCRLAPAFRLTYGGFTQLEAQLPDMERIVNRA